MEPLIYSFVSKKLLGEVVQSLHSCINLPVQILDETGRVLEHYGEKSGYCAHFVSCISDPDSCQKIHSAAGRRSLSLGESYIFSCHSGLTHIIFPLNNNSQLFGSVLIGPFLMQEPDSTMITDIRHTYPDFKVDDLMELYDQSKYLPIIAPEKVTQISRLLYFLFNGLVEGSRQQLIINQEKLYQQAKISESMQQYKEFSVLSSPYPLEKEQELLRKLKTGNLDDAKAILNDLLGYVFLTTGNDLDIAKSRSIELCSLLSRAAMESGAPQNQILRLNNEYIKNVRTLTSIENLCFSLSEVLTNFVEYIYPTLSDKNSHIIQDAMVFISQNYADPITLSDVANHVHLNSAYLSRIFKQVCGSSFKEYLSVIRVEESKRLLKTTALPLMDIAIATGFEGQSYFTKVFKKYTGLTPKQFRAG